MNPNTKNIVAWVLTAMVAFMMIKAGGTKLIGHEVEVARFTKWGFPIWFMYMIGSLEVAGGIGLFIPKLRTLTIIGIIGIMLGAIYTHIFLDNHPTHIGGAVLVSVLSIAVFALRKGEHVSA